MTSLFSQVQLPGYTATISNGTGSYPQLGGITAEMVFDMRLQQAAGAAAPTANASYIVTYDLSCSDPVGCPYGALLFAVCALYLDGRKHRLDFTLLCPNPRALH